MKKNDDVVKVLKKSMRLKVLMLLAIMLTFNTFAWFVYSNTVSNSISTYVKAWKIEFKSGEEIVEIVEFEIDELYPGMPEYSNFINIVNYGETQADITYEVISIKILEDIYDQTTYTSQELEDMLLNDYPFVIQFSLSNAVINPFNGSSDFEVNATWAYESGNDVLDTQWGHNSYNFKEEYPLDKQIVLVVKLHANQPN